MAERRLHGTAAAPGVAVGPARHARERPRADRAPVDDPQGEAANLERAAARAAVELAELAAGSDEAAAAILGFQSALLEDAALLEPARARVAAGVPAARAVASSFAEQIALYADDEDDYFRARAADLADLRDRLLRALPDGDADGDDGPAADPAGAVLVADDLTPSGFLVLHGRGLAAAALGRGSAASHVAMLARARGVPLVTGLGPEIEAVPAGATLLVEGALGMVIVAPDPGTLGRHAAGAAARAAAEASELDWRARPAATAAGRRVLVAINVEGPESVLGLEPGVADGIGLVRTEFLYHGPSLPDEARQLDAYRRLIAWAGGRPVTFRTLDAGGDKPVLGVTSEGERNPFLGLRGLRLTLARPDLFRVQLRALARAAPLGPVEVMFPMVTSPREIDAARALFRDVVAELAAEGAAAVLPRLGMMVETPAAALAAELFAVDFYSIGSNDLVQYTLAVARDEPSVAALWEPLHPAVLELIARVVETGRRLGRPVGLCGDMAGDPAAIPRLLELGLERLSVAPAALGRTKRAIAGWGAPG